MKTSVFGLTFGILVLALIGTVQARDDGRYAHSPLKPWFDSLRSGKGLCCSDADGFAVSDPDWESKSGHYRVRIDNEWVDVPDEAVITEPLRQDHGLADQGVARDFNSLLHAWQHDAIQGLWIQGLDRDLGFFSIAERSCTVDILTSVKAALAASP